MDSDSHFEGMEADEYDDIISSVRQLEIHVEDREKKKLKSLSTGRIEQKLQTALDELVDYVDQFLQRPHPSKPTQVEEIILDDMARHLIRDLDESIDGPTSELSRIIPELSNHLEELARKTMPKSETDIVHDDEPAAQPSSSLPEDVELGDKPQRETADEMELDDEPQGETGEDMDVDDEEQEQVEEMGGMTELA